MFKYFSNLKLNILCIIWFNISRFSIPHTHTQNSLLFNLPFSPLTLLPLYIYLPIALHVIPCQIYIDQKRVIYLSLLFHIILTRMSCLQPKNGDLRFILSDNSNDNFDIKVERCGFEGFINNVIDRECLECVFCFGVKKKEKIIFYVNFYSIIFLQSFFFFFFSHYFNSIIIMHMYVQFIIVVFMMNSLLIKFYKNYAIIHIQYSSKPSCIKHYYIICSSHG